MLAEGRVKVSAVQDGAQLEARFDRTGALVVTHGHGEFYELASRGLVFSALTAIAGTTMVTGNETAGAAVATMLSVWNPVGSTVNLCLLKAHVQLISGTPAAGSFALYGGVTAAITATPNVVIKGHLVGSEAGRAKAFTQTALTGSSAQARIRNMPAGGFAGPVAATTNVVFIDEALGDIVVPPGSVLSIVCPGLGTTQVVAGGMTWAEIDI